MHCKLLISMNEFRSRTARPLPRCRSAANVARCSCCFQQALKRPTSGNGVMSKDFKKCSTITTTQQLCARLTGLKATPCSTPDSRPSMTPEGRGHVVGVTSAQKAEQHVMSGTGVQRAEQQASTQGSASEEAPAPGALAAPIGIQVHADIMPLQRIMADQGGGKHPSNRRSVSGPQLGASPHELVQKKVTSLFNGKSDDVLRLQDVIGKGAWGTVYKGTWKGLTVAVKTVSNLKSS
ncbi:hypothetical protein DUNSADRAFT_15745, partial [Dunaliella salina]